MPPTRAGRREEPEEGGRTAAGQPMSGEGADRRSGQVPAADR